MAQHFTTYGAAETFACGADAVGQRNTRLDEDPTQTTCTRCMGTEAHAAKLAEHPGIITRADLIRRVARVLDLSLPVAADRLTKATEQLAIAGTAYTRQQAGEAFLLISDQA